MVSTSHELSTDASLDDAKNYVATRMVQPGGIACPCCEQFVKVYKRMLNSDMVSSLIFMSRHISPGSYIHAAELHHMAYEAGIKKNRERGDFTKCQYWNFIYSMPSGGTVKPNGMWTITQKGLDFINGLITVPSYCLFYNGSVLEWADDSITVNDAMREHFCYEKLMSS